MEHANPILLGNNSPQKFITIGEVMLRLTPPNYEKIRMASSFEASYGGSEANIALALANLGVDSTFFSVVPNNSLGKSAIRWLRCNDVHCTPMILSTKEETPSCRLGTYYLETGYGIRPSKVIYDRMHSALTEYDLTKVNLQELFEGFDWLHLSGITPALNKNCADFILRWLREAYRISEAQGLRVAFLENTPFLQGLIAPLRQPGLASAARDAADVACDAAIAAAIEDACRPVARAADALTERELDVLRAVADGASVAEAARVLVVSRETVKKHLGNIYTKLGVHSKMQAVALLREEGTL